MKAQLLFLGFLGLWGMATIGFAEPVCSHVDIDWISTHITLSPDARIVMKREEGQLCEVILAIGSNLAPVYAGKDFILVGQLFKEGRSTTLENMNNLSDVSVKERQIAAEKNALEKEKRKFFFKKNIKSFEKFVSISLKSGPIKNFLYVITDPNCPHCKDLLPRLEQAALESGVELKVIIYPILGTKSREMSVHAICNKYSYKAYTEIKTVESTSSCEQADRLLEKTDVFFRSAGLSFVPIVVAGDGSWVVEDNDVRKVRAHLSIESGSEGNGPGGVCISDHGR